MREVGNIEFLRRDCFLFVLVEGKNYFGSG